MALQPLVDLVAVVDGLATGLVLTRARRHLASRWLWMGLGIATLLLVVPISLGATHQGVAMLLFTVALFLCHALKRNA